MYFTETPHLQRLERQMTEIPHQIPRSSCFRCNGKNRYDSNAVKIALLILLDSFDSRKLEKRVKGLGMKPTFIDESHYERFKQFFYQNILSPAHCSRNYVAAVFLLSSVPELWNRVNPHISRDTVNFEKMRIGSVDTETYATFKAAKEVYTDKAEITISELCDSTLVNDRTISNVFTAMLIENNGYGIVDTTKFQEQPKAV